MKIIVSGVFGEGKTTVVGVIVEALRRLGMSVEVPAEEEEELRHTKTSFCRQAMAGRKVDIETVQLRRELVVREVPSVPRRCPGSCSRGGDGPACGLPGCQG